MKLKFADLWNPNGTVNRANYALVGVLGFAVKHNLDRVVATYVFHRPWGLFNYWMPIRDVGRITALGGSQARFLETMVALALPFIWVGVVMTLKRLRSAGLPTALVALFFLPFLNLLFFVALLLAPEQESRFEWRTRPRDSWLARIAPESAMGSAALALLLTVPVGLCIVLLGVRLLVNYGWGLFVALPFAMGLAAAVTFGVCRPRSLRSCV